MNKRYFKIYRGSSKSVGFCGVYQNHNWDSYYLRMLEGPSKGLVIRISKDNTQEFGSKDGYEKYISKRDGVKKETSKTYGVMVGDTIACLDLTVDAAKEEVVKRKLICPSHRVFLINVIGEASEPVTSVAIK